MGLFPLTMKSGRFTPDKIGVWCEDDENGYLLLPVLMFLPKRHSVPSHEAGNMIVTSLNCPGVNPSSDFVAS